MAQNLDRCWSPAQKDGLKRHIRALIEHPQYKPMKLKELAVLLQIPREERELLEALLSEMVAEGNLGYSRRGKYGKAEELVLDGTFTATAKGFGFVTVDGIAEDFFVSETNCGTAMHGDMVRITMIHAGGMDGARAEAKVVRVLERKNTEVVGSYQAGGKYGFVIPDNTRLQRDIFIAAGNEKGAVTGHKVVVRLLSYGDASHKPEGIVTEILGHRNDPGVDITSIVRAFGIPDEFSEEVMEQTAGIPLTVSPEYGSSRLDLRAIPTVTIDGEDARDLDDAVTVERTDRGYRLGVHIADVSEYVTEGSPLDEEAKRRGTSNYLTDRVIPMLPHRLSNGICSLNQGEDRLALSCIMEIDPKGSIIDHTITETKIRVDRRMTYAAVQQVLDGESAAREEYSDFVELFLLMKELADLLRARRRKRGSIDFDMPETKIVLDEKGKPVDIHPYVRSDATNIIEDFMLAANETVAEHYYWQDLPFVYRVHEKPDPEKIGELTTLLRSFGTRVRLKDGDIQSWELQKILADIADSPEEAFLSRMALRSMKQAKYQVDCIGHFGLAATYYCHFTSPIRRYPDLQIHRIIKENLRGQLDDRRTVHYHNILPEVCQISSMTECRADEAERLVIKRKMAQFMIPRKGQVFSGMISGVTKWGLYVELPNTVEGLVHIRNMTDDYYSYDEKKHELVGERKRKNFRIGQEVRVRLMGVDLMANTIDFQLMSGESHADGE